MIVDNSIDHLWGRDSSLSDTEVEVTSFLAQIDQLPQKYKFQRKVQSLDQASQLITEFARLLSLADKIIPKLQQNTEQLSEITSKQAVLREARASLLRYVRMRTKDFATLSPRELNDAETFNNNLTALQYHLSLLGLVTDTQSFGLVTDHQTQQGKNKAALLKLLLSTDTTKSPNQDALTTLKPSQVLHDLRFLASCLLKYKNEPEIAQHIVPLILFFKQIYQEDRQTLSKLVEMEEDLTSIASSITSLASHFFLDKSLFSDSQNESLTQLADTLFEAPKQEIELMQKQDNQDFIRTRYRGYFSNIQNALSLISRLEVLLPELNDLDQSFELLYKFTNAYLDLRELWMLTATSKSESILQYSSKLYTQLSAFGVTLVEITTAFTSQFKRQHPKIYDHLLAQLSPALDDVNDSSYRQQLELILSKRQAELNNIPLNSIEILLIGELAYQVRKITNRRFDTNLTYKVDTNQKAISWLIQQFDTELTKRKQPTKKFKQFVDAILERDLTKLLVVLRKISPPESNNPKSVLFYLNLADRLLISPLFIQIFNENYSTTTTLTTLKNNLSALKQTVTE